MTIEKIRRYRARLWHSPLARRFAKGAFWIFFGTAGSKVFGLLGNIAVTRLVHKEAFGEISMVFTTYTLFQFASASYFGATANRYVAAYRDKHPERIPWVVSLTLASTTAVGLICAMGLFFGAKTLAAGNLNAPHLAYPLQIVTVTVFCTAINSVLMGILGGYEKFRLVSILTIVTNVITPLCLVLGAFSNRINGYFTGFAIAAVAGLAVDCVIVGRVLRRQDITLRKCLRAPREWAILWDYTFPAMLCGIMMVPVQWYCQQYLFKSPDGKAQMGAYAAAYQYLMIVMFMIKAFSDVASPMLANLFGSGDLKRYRRMFLGSFATTVGTATALSAAIALLGPFLMGIFGKEFRNDYNILYVICVLAVTQSADTMANRLVGSCGKLWINTAGSALLAIVSLGVSLYLIPNYGAVGLGWGQSLGNVARFAFNAIYMEIFFRRVSSKR